MKVQIARLSPHQNGKVAAVLMALSSLLLMVPLALVFAYIPSGVDAHGNPVSPPMGMLLLFPVIYLVMGYVMVALACVIYNVMFKFIGGIEYQTKDMTE